MLNSEIQIERQHSNSTVLLLMDLHNNNIGPREFSEIKSRTAQRKKILGYLNSICWDRQKTKKHNNERMIVESVLC